MHMTLDEVIEFLDNIPNINCGGCGVAALALSRWMKENTPMQEIEFTYCYSNTDEPYYYENCEKAQNNSFDSTTVPCHVMLQTPIGWVDSEGIKNYVPKYPLFHNVNESFLLNTLNNPTETYGWNFLFNVQNIDEIEKVLKVDLSDVDLKQRY